MTTKCLDNKICTFKILLSWRFPRKTAVWTIFLSVPQGPPLKKRKFYLYCRLAVSLTATPEAKLLPKTFWGSANLPEKVSRDMGYRSDSIAISRDMGPLSLVRFAASQGSGMARSGVHDDAGTEPELETGTVRTVFLATKTGTVWACEMGTICPFGLFSPIL